MVDAVRQFFAGFLLPLRGGLLLLRQRRLLAVAAAPLLLDVLLYLAAFLLVVHYYEEWFGLLWAQPTAWYWYAGYVVLRFGAFLLLLALLFFSFVFVGTAVAAPFLEVLSARVEQLLQAQETTAPTPRLSWLQESLRALGHAILLLGLWLGVLPLSFVPVLGPPLWLVISWLFLAYNFATFAFARRPWSFREQWRRLLHAWAATLGFGAAVFLILLVPLLGLVLLPTAAVGGALLVRMLDTLP